MLTKEQKLEKLKTLVEARAAELTESTGVQVKITKACVIHQLEVLKTFGTDFNLESARARQDVFRTWLKACGIDDSGIIRKLGEGALDKAVQIFDALETLFKENK